MLFRSAVLPEAVRADSFQEEGFLIHARERLKVISLSPTDILSNIVFGSSSDTSLPYSKKMKQMIYRNSYMMPEIAVIDVTVENYFCGSPVNNSLTFAPDMMFGTLEEEN